MFKIDLLEGSGVPIRSSPQGLAIIGITAAIPLIAILLMLDIYADNSIDITVQRQEIVNVEKKINKFNDVVQMKKKVEAEKTALNSSLSEVAKTIGRYAQWSPVMETLVRNLPDSMIMTKLNVKSRSIKMKAPHGSAEAAEINVPVRTLELSICGSDRNNYDRAVKDYTDQLSSSDVFKPIVDDIRVSREIERLENDDVVSYKIECILKPSL